ncbi:hypothetical protein QJS10_CPA01g00323 [Acorus calamus]|uniref:RNase H type-1 domain-containing protein n=1 Tax=Acorus calamus TaxID=4465 RepID=A0AAV9FL72_ACOCL|nr:hypothetical protein QJS10_CPA01g00323 [Acorus calamus]
MACISSWFPSQGERVYVLSDGSVDLVTRAAGVGFVLLIPEPLTVIASGCAYWPWASPLRMEAEAIRYGVQYARKLKFRNIFVCSDAEVLIKLLNDPGPGPPQLMDVISAIRCPGSQGEYISYVKVPRQCVTGPEALAKYARQAKMSLAGVFAENQKLRSLLGPHFSSFHLCIDVVKHVIFNSALP